MVGMKEEVMKMRKVVCGGLKTVFVVLLLVALIIIAGCSGNAIRASGGKATKEEKPGELGMGGASDIAFGKNYEDRLPPGAVFFDNLDALSKAIGFQVRVPSEKIAGKPSKYVMVKDILGTHGEKEAVLIVYPKIEIYEARVENIEKNTDFNVDVQMHIDANNMQTGRKYPREELPFVGTINGHQALMFPLAYYIDREEKEPEPPKVEWCDGDIFYLVNAKTPPSITLDEVVKIAESFYAEEK